ncbi:putative autotransporter adhesin-like protein [Salegentibacter sp. 24]|uniref:head GIN domain-containing protein n=1 Tax=Salegentibacter sp. 24 TaxID=2183986 RepID=UPI00105E284E|nr:head GIN domain-containing protein [Salegentibacter sp. 24]TDN82362.1 putative autotransporter adhesin-like protein [Salegentibacter sp. 24]
MKKLFLILAVSCLGYSPVQAQWWGNSETVKGNGEMTSEKRNTGDYDEISLVGSMDVELVRGTEGNLTVVAESNLQEYITTEVNNNILKISVKKGYNLKPNKNNNIKITVPFDHIDAVEVTGSGDLWNSATINAKNFSTALTGSGDIKLEVEVENLEATITGSGDTQLSGKAQDFEVNVKGSGDFKAYDLKADNVEATVMGSGDIRVSANSRLKAKVMGSGDITYNGNPKHQDFKTSGSGSISSN